MVGQGQGLSEQGLGAVLGGEVGWGERPKVENGKGGTCPQSLGAERRGRRGLEEAWPRASRIESPCSSGQW